MQWRQPRNGHLPHVTVVNTMQTDFPQPKASETDFPQP